MNRQTALTDRNGVLTGFTKDLEAEGISVPDPCDLTISKYYWDGEKKCWMAIEKSSQEIETHNPGVVSAMALGMMAIRDSGLVDLPAETLAWLENFEKTWDGRGRAKKGKSK